MLIKCFESFCLKRKISLYCSKSSIRREDFFFLRKLILIMEWKILLEVKRVGNLLLWTYSEISNLDECKLSELDFLGTENYSRFDSSLSIPTEPFRYCSFLHYRHQYVLGTFFYRVGNNWVNIVGRVSNYIWSKW